MLERPENVEGELGDAGARRQLLGLGGHAVDGGAQDGVGGRVEGTGEVGEGAVAHEGEQPPPVRRGVGLVVGGELRYSEIARRRRGTSANSEACARGDSPSRVGYVASGPLATTRRCPATAIVEPGIGLVSRPISVTSLPSAVSGGGKTCGPRLSQ